MRLRGYKVPGYEGGYQPDTKPGIGHGENGYEGSLRGVQHVRRERAHCRRDKGERGGNLQKERAEVRG